MSGLIKRGLAQSYFKPNKRILPIVLLSFDFGNILAKKYINILAEHKKKVFGNADIADLTFNLLWRGMVAECCLATRLRLKAVFRANTLILYRHILELLLV